MQCPSVIGFLPVSRSTVCKKVTSDFAENNIDFCHSISLVLPNGPNLAESIQKVVDKDPYFYQLVNVSVPTFLQTQFIENFVKKGKLSVFSIESHPETTDTFAINEGTLYLSLLKDTAQTVNLSKHTDYIEEVKKFGNFIKYKINVEKINKFPDARKELSKLGYFSALLHWHPHSDDVKKTEASVKRVPEFDVNYLEDVGNFMEWMGAVILDCNLESDDYLSTYDIPQPNKEANIFTLQYNGLIGVDLISSILKVIREHSEDLWSAVYIKTFPSHRKDSLIKENRNYLMLYKEMKSVCFAIE